MTAPFKNSWNTLTGANKEPEWLKDAKFGIYAHWGPYCVPAFGNEWYPRWMYIRNPRDWAEDVLYGASEEGAGDIADYHEKTFGPPSKFNYHDFIPIFRGEQFDAAEWADLFAKAGARFAGTVAQHHDGFAMWNSRSNPWNAQAKGPRQDILGELFVELQKRGLKTLATFHHARTLQRFADDPAKWGGWDSHFPYHPDFATSSTDPELKYMYGNLPADEYHDYWLELIREVVDGYGPDIIWFDWWLDRIPEEYRERMVALQYEAGRRRGNENVVVYKTHALPRDLCVLDMEQAGMIEMSPDYWMTDITLSFESWSYVQGQTYKPVELLLRNMIDVWSKKGVVLLNICPKADGSICDEQRRIAGEVGAWLSTYGEAVYGTRTHEVFGYGTAQIKTGFQGEGQTATIEYSAEDVRFTRSRDGRTVYAFLLGLPPAHTPIEIRNVLHDDSQCVHDVSLLAGRESLEWRAAGDGITLITPSADEMNAVATVFKIRLGP